MSSTFPKPLDEKEELEYIKMMENGDKQARDILIERNLRLVAHIARKYSSSGFDTDDLISIGTIGLIKGIDTYAPSKSRKIATYISKCIENEILMSIRSTKKIRQEVSISLPIGNDKDGNEISLFDIIGTETDEISDNLNLKIQIDRLYNAIDQQLTKREKEIIIKRFGLFGFEPETQREISKEINISRSYVSRIEKKALEKLKAALTDYI